MAAVPMVVPGRAAQARMPSTWPCGVQVADELGRAVAPPPRRPGRGRSALRTAARLVPAAA